MVVVRADDAAGRCVVPHGVPLSAVAVVRRREHHGGLVRLCVLVVEVDHAAAAVRGAGHTGGEEEKTRDQLD